MLRRWRGFLAGVVVGVLIAQSVAVASVRWNYFVRDSLRLESPKENFPDPIEKPSLSVGSIVAGDLQGNRIVAFKQIQGLQFVSMGIDLRLFGENLLGALVQKGTLTEDQAKQIIARSTEEAAGFQFLPSDKEEEE